VSTAKSVVPPKRATSSLPPAVGPIVSCSRRVVKSDAATEVAAQVRARADERAAGPWTAGTRPPSTTTSAPRASAWTPPPLCRSTCLCPIADDTDCCHPWGRADRVRGCGWRRGPSPSGQCVARPSDGRRGGQPHVQPRFPPKARGAPSSSWSSPFRVPGLVEPPTATRRDRPDPTHPEGDRSLRSTPATQPGPFPMNRVPPNPGALHCRRWHGGKSPGDKVPGGRRVFSGRL